MTASRLDSWKEIAEYVGRDVRTAIRWEHERRFPVHRVPGGRRGGVFALREEIDAWLLTATEGVEPSAALAPVDAPAGSTPTVGGPAAPARQRRRWFLTVGAGLAVALALAGLTWRARGASGRIDPVRVVVRPRALVAFDATDRELWTVSFDRTLIPSPLGLEPVVSDLDGDGRSEVLAAVDVEQSPRTAEGQLLCLSADGSVLWRRAMDDEVVFRAARFGPPWRMGIVVPYATPDGVRIAWAESNSPSWPGVVAVLDPAGRRLGRFVHSGAVYALTAMEGVHGPLLIGGSVSNSQRAAAVFVLDGLHVRGHSVEPPGSLFECLSCEKGAPLRYFLFPPNELNRASDAPYNSVLQVQRHGSGLHVQTVEHFGQDGGVANQLFWFSRDLVLERSAQSDSWPLHEYLERKGRLDHVAADCPMYRTEPVALEGDPIRGWRPVESKSVAAPSLPGVVVEFASRP